MHVTTNHTEKKQSHQSMSIHPWIILHSPPLLSIPPHPENKHSPEKFEHNPFHFGSPLRPLSMAWGFPCAVHRLQLNPMFVTFWKAAFAIYSPSTWNPKPQAKVAFNCSWMEHFLPDFFLRFLLGCFHQTLVKPLSLLNFLPPVGCKRSNTTQATWWGHEVDLFPECGVVPSEQTAP